MRAPHLRPLSPPCLRPTLLLTILIVAAVGLLGKSTAPDWVKAAADQPASFNYGKANAAVLLDEASIEIDVRGSFTERKRWVVRLINRDGKTHAVAQVPYNAVSSRVKSLKAWLIRPSGEVVTYGSKETIDVAAYTTARELYGEGRLMRITAEEDVSAGSVFAYEAVVVEEQSVFSHWVRPFQAAIPVERSAIAITLPEGWQVESRALHHEPVPPVVQGKTSMWELRQLPAVESEPFSPPASASMASLGLEVRPPTDAKTMRKYFGSWSAISAYLTPKYDAASIPETTLRAKADELVANAGTQWEQIRQLCRYAQNVNYISIYMNAAAMGGVIPRDATQVLRCNYGDCKDKTTLLRALLRAKNIESFPLIVNSGGGRYVIPDWPAMSQFNHCILAIKVDDTANGPALLAHPTFGRLMIFDPTNIHTPLGWLPGEDCEGRGLLLADAQGELIAIPKTIPADNTMERKIDARMFADGAVSGTMQEAYHGLSSTNARRDFLTASASDYRRQLEKRLAGSLPAVRLTKIAPFDRFDQAEFSLTTEFTAPAHGQRMRNELLVFKPILISRFDGSTLKKEPRKQPVVIQPASFLEHSVIELPPGYRLDEMPAPVEFKTSFGSYSARTTLKDNKQLVIDRTIEFYDATLPAADYDSVRSYFEKIQQAEQTPVVLRKNESTMPVTN